MQRLRTRLRASASTGAPPSLSLDFLGLNQTLDSRITFSRGSAATLTDSTGKLTYAPNNLVTFSEQFDNAAWTKGAAVTIGANAGTAPDGTTTADQITITGADNGVYQSVTVVPGVAYVQSWYVRLGTLSASDYKFALYNNTAGSFIAADIAPSPTPNSTGWTRITYTFTAPAGCTSVRVYVNRSPSVSAGTLFVWGAQLEQVTYQTTPGTYNATTASAYYGPRFDYDPVTLNPKGLLIEEQRTNLLTYSEQFDNAAWGAIGGTISANSTTSPDGTVDADSFVESAGSTDPRLPRGVTLVIGTTYALSVYAKIIPGSAQRYLMLVFNAGFSTQPGVNFDLVTGTVGTTNGGATGTITAVGNGWYRCSIVTPAATATSASFRYRIASVNTSANIAGPTPYTGDGASGYYFYGAQLEAGAFATSYIPTVASTVTRSADVATMTGTNFSSWYNQSEGTFAVDASVILNTGNRVWMDVGPAGAFGTTAYIVQTTGSVSLSSGSPVNMTSSVNTTSLSNKAAIAIANNNAVVAVNGVLGSVDTACTMPASATQLTLGAAVWGAGGSMLNGHIRRLAYYPTRLADYQLQGLTA